MTQSDADDHLLAELWDLARATARRFSSSIDADDVAQHTVEEYLKATKRTTVRRPQGLVVDIAKKLSMKALEKETRQASTRRRLSALPQVTPPSTETLIAAHDEVLALLDVAHDRLGPQQFAALVAYYLGDCSIDEATALLGRLAGMSPEAVKKNIQRAKKNMRDLGEQP